ncbi:hypothetical protein CBER1_07163 [Cercospora berteroae]|uniref:Uncharacterized protein n=1 Tax=Cercospora berteroae TaxID=357750 RepID=A0A2S6CFJ6_9PEZI|nr:hypothetical protein CBER1_07163 [Cercospora berteroae]
MASFAPVYRLPTSQQSFLTREQKRERKRKRNAKDADQDDEVSSDEHEQKTEAEISAPVKLEASQNKPRVLHPVHKRDPYYVAGWSREHPLPGGNFPHAAYTDPAVEKPSVEDELARLNPPIYVPKKRPDDPIGSVRGRHLNNLTAILHKCMLNQDWSRASRAWGLILRTEIAGFAPDVRQHGRWMVGAELLMRRDQRLQPLSTSVDEQGSETDRSTTSSSAPVISDEGFQLAREYYERMCLQYPHIPRARHSSVNAYAIYPALFNIWLYEIQDRSQRARQRLADLHEAAEFDDVESVRSDQPDQKRSLRLIRLRELSEAGPLVKRLDDLFLNPPYDTSPELLELRGMISLWLANVHRSLAEVKDLTETDHDGGTTDLEESEPSSAQHQIQAEMERDKAKEIFQRMTSRGMKLSPENSTFLEGDNSRVDGDEG